MKQIETLLCMSIFAASLLAPGYGTAEPERGRLLDGRAYRTDAEGNQIIDYIAELELNLEAQNRRIHGLEYELEEKQRLIDRLQSSKYVSNGLQERDIPIAGRTSKPKADPEEVRQCRAQLTTLQQQLDSAEQSLAMAKSDLQIDQQMRVQEIRDLRTKLGELQQAYSKKEQELTLLQTKLQDSEKERREAQEMRAALARQQEQERREQERRAELQAKEQAEAAAREERQAAETRAAALAPDPAPSLSAARQRAVESLKGKLRTELNRVRTLVATRDRSYEQYRRSASASAVSFKPAPAVTTDGLTVSELRKRLDEAASVREIGRYQSDIRQIERKIQDDIALIRRLQAAQR